MFNKVANVRLDGIHLKNFMSFKDVKIDNLSKHKIIFILSSNATGKSTITSEALYFGLFGRSLRYSNIKKLLRWDFTSGDAFANIDLAVRTINNIETTLKIRRNIISEPKYSIEVENDPNEFFNELVDITKSGKFTDVIRSILDLDEKKFSILYLKSPFSEVIFESNSNLLASITKVNFINNLRSDFSGIVTDLRSKVNYINDSIKKQEELIRTIRKELDSDNESKSSDMVSDKQKLDNILKELEIVLQKQKRLIDHKNANNKNKMGRDKQLRSVVDYKSQCYSDMQRCQQELDKYKKLIAMGKCPSCEQSISANLYDTDVGKLESKLATVQADYDKYNNFHSELKTKLSEIDTKSNAIYEYESQFNNEYIRLSSLKTQLQTAIAAHTKDVSSANSILAKIENEISKLNVTYDAASREYSVVNVIYTKLLSKKNKYINQFYNQKIQDFNNVFKKLLNKFTQGKFYEVKIMLNNKPILNEYIEYEALSTSERKYIDIAFVISYIVYLSTHLKFRSFILDEFFDNFDQKNISHIYNIIYDVAKEYDLQLFITSNIADYILDDMQMHDGNNEDVKVIDLRQLIGLDDEIKPIIDLGDSDA